MKADSQPEHKLTWQEEGQKVGRMTSGCLGCLRTERSGGTGTGRAAVLQKRAKRESSRVSGVRERFPDWTQPVFQHRQLVSSGAF